jgi:hypothetical protein
MRRIGAGFGPTGAPKPSVYESAPWGVNSLSIEMANTLFANSGLRKHTQKLLYDKFAAALAKEKPYGYVKDAQGSLKNALEPASLDAVIRQAASDLVGDRNLLRQLSPIDKDILRNKYLNWDSRKDTPMTAELKKKIFGIDGKREMGGPVSPGQNYVVGEKGPEIFSPSQSGNIIPGYEVGGVIRYGKDSYGVSGNPAKRAAEAAAKAEAERLAAEEEAREQAEADAKAEEERLAAEAEAKEQAEADAKAEAEAIAQEEANAKAEAEAAAEAEKKELEEAAAEGTLTPEQKTEVANTLIEEANGGPVSAEAIAAAGIEYKDLPPETPVEVRQDENGNEVIITADVAAALVLLENPAELIGAIFSDPSQALKALGSIGADMSTQEREEATNMVVATVVAAGAAMNAVSAAAGTTGGTTSGGSTGGGGGGGSGGGSGESKGIRRRKP